MTARSIGSIRLVRRGAPSRTFRLLAPVLAVALTAATGALLFAALGQEPGRALRTAFVEPVTDVNGWSELLLKASPLCLIALGLAFSFRAGVWNIGAEGQMYLGGVFATALALRFPDGGPWLLPAMIAAGALGGALWAAIPAALRAHLRTSEVLVSLMLTYVADLVVKALVYGPWRDPEGNNFPLTAAFGDAALFPLLASWGWTALDGTRLNASVLLTLAAVPLFWLLADRSFPGFRLRVAGLAPAAARYAGFGARRAVWTALLVSGASAGLAGVGEVAGPLGQLNDRWTPQYGFTAIIVAALARLQPPAIPIAALLIALLHLGGEALQVGLQLPKAVGLAFQGLLLVFLLACDVLVHFRVRRVAAPA
jgi:simple sugar transport system permease protein